MKVKIFTVLFLLFPMFYNAAINESYKQKMQKLISVYGKKDLFSGSVLVAKEGEIIFNGSTGYSDKVNKIKNTIRTRFNIGSIGKTITATAIMQLFEKGKIKLSDPLEKYFPDLQFPYKNKITIHHLLNHTSGLQNYMTHKNYQKKGVKVRKISEILPMVFDQKPLFKPSSKFRYSNSGMIVLGAIIEKVSGLSYKNYIKENIFEPVGMNDSSIIYREEMDKNYAIGYIKKGKNYLNNLKLEPPAFSDGGLYTTILDLLKFDQALYSNIILTERSKTKMFTPEKGRGYAYGWGTGKMYGHRLVGHGGGAPGISAMFYRYLNKKVTIIVLSNYDRAAGKLFGKLEAVIFDKPYKLPE